MADARVAGAQPEAQFAALVDALAADPGQREQLTDLLREDHPLYDLSEAYTASPLQFIQHYGWPTNNDLYEAMWRADPKWDPVSEAVKQLNDYAALIHPERDEVLPDVGRQPGETRSWEISLKTEVPRLISLFVRPHIELRSEFRVQVELHNDLDDVSTQPTWRTWRAGIKHYKI